MESSTNDTWFYELQARLRGLARRRVGAAAAEDLSQDILTLILKKGLHLRWAAEDLTRWACQALTYRVQNFRRATTKARRRAVALEALPEAAEIATTAPSALEQMLAQERRAAVRRALAQLRPKQRRLLSLFLAGCAPEVMMQTLGLRTRKALAHQYQRATRRLREILIADGYPLPTSRTKPGERPKD